MRSLAGRLVVFALAGLTVAAPCAAQTPAAGKLLVTVVDPSGAVIPGAKVTVIGLDNSRSVPAPVNTAANGLASIAGVAPGRYSIQAEFAGFETSLLKDIRVNAGDNKHVVILKIKNVTDAVTVSQDAQLAAADRRSGGFGSVLTREEITALSDDPAEMRQQLLDMAGGNAIIRVDSFVGRALPPKSMIRSIHVIRDTFAAENHSAESDEIEIITQPGVGELEGGVNMRMRDGRLSGKSQFTPVKGHERTQNVEGNLAGTAIPQKASFALSGGSRRSFDQPIVNAALAGGGQVSQVLNVRRPNNNWTTYDLFDYALTKDQILRMSYDQSNTVRENLGLGGFSYLAERAYSTTSHDHAFRISETGPLGRRVFANTRLELNWDDSRSRSASEAVTIDVLQNSVRGGAQVAGGTHALDFELASDIDYIRGKHSVRAGVLIEGGRFRSDTQANYLGTFTFTSLDAYAAGTPSAYTRRIGDPHIEYWNISPGVYIQDDLRISKGLTISPGLRYEVQTHVKGAMNFGPRFGVTWAPFKSGRTTLRTSLGGFNNWLGNATYEQTLRVDGRHQQDINIANPAYPVAGTGGVIPPTNKYVLGDVQLVRTIRISAGIDQALTPRIRVSAVYSHVHGEHATRGVDLNRPVNGVRPDASFANIIEVLSDARTRTHQLQTNLTINFAPQGRGASQQRVNLRRANVRLSYTLAKAENNTDGAFAVPASGTLETEWAPTAGDRRHRVSMTLNSQAIRNLNATLSLAANTGTPYTLLTGVDNNGDLIFNDRPAGAGRNTLRTAGQYTVNANVSYAVPLSDNDRVSFTAQIVNLTNHANFGGYSGSMTSRFFRLPTLVQNPRKVDFGLNFSF